MPSPAFSSPEYLVLILHNGMSCLPLYIDGTPVALHRIFGCGKLLSNYREAGNRAHSETWLLQSADNDNGAKSIIRGNGPESTIK